MTIIFRSGEDGDLGFFGLEEVKSQATFDSRKHEVFNTDVSEGAPGHDPIVAAAGTVAVKVFGRNTLGEEVGPGWRRLFDVAGRRDVIGGDGIAKNAEAASGLEGGSGGKGESKIGKEGGLLNVGTLTIPSVGLPRFGGDFVPSRVLLRKISVKFLKDLRLKSRLHSLADFLASGPKITEVNGLAIFSEAEGILG